MKIVSKKAGGLMFAAGAVGLPASICAMFAWPFFLMAVMLAFDLEPSGEWDALTILANLGNLVVYGGAMICMFVSPMLAMVGTVLYVLADQQERRPRP